MQYTVDHNLIAAEHTTLKLKQAGMSFIQAMLRKADLEKIEPVSQVFLSSLLKIIDEPEEKDETMRRFAFECIASVAKRVPKLFERDFDILNVFFHALTSESNNVRVSVQSSLFQILPIYKSIISNHDLEVQLLEIMCKYSTSVSHHARFAILKFANEIFPFSNVTCRYLCLLLSCDNRTEVKEEARKGLNIPESTNNMKALPVLKDMIFILETRTAFQDRTISLNPGSSYVGNIPNEIFISIVCFLRNLLLCTALPYLSIIFKVNYDEQYVLQSEQILEFKFYLKNILTLAGANKMGLEAFVNWLKLAINGDKTDSVLISFASLFLLELIASGPNDLFSFFASDAINLTNLIASRKAETRHNIAHIFGIVATCELNSVGKIEAFNRVYAEMIKVASDESTANFDGRHGSILALGFITGRLIYRNQTKFVSMIPSIVIEQAIYAIADALSGQNWLIIAACQSLAEIGRYGLLPQGKLLSTEQSLASIQTRLMGIIKFSKEAKVKEVALAAICHLCIGNRYLIDETLLFIKTLPVTLSANFEMQFNVGDGLCCVLFGFASLQMAKHLDIQETKEGALVSNATFEIAAQSIRELIAMVQPDQSAVSRKAGCIWLLCILKYCAHNYIVKTLMLDIHKAFTSLLEDRDGI